MDLGPVAQVALGQADLGVPGPADPGRTGHRALMALVPKKACARVPARMQRVRRWDRDLRDRPWPKENRVPKVLGIVGRDLIIVDHVMTVDRALIIVDRDSIVDRDLKVLLRVTADRDPKVLLRVTADRDLKVLGIVGRDLIIVDRVMTVDRDLIIVDRAMTADRDLTEREVRKRAPLKVLQQFRRPNLRRRNKQQSRSSSFRPPNPRRL